MKNYSLSQKFLMLLSPLLLVWGSFASFSLQAKPAKRIGISLPTQRDIGWVRYREAFSAEAKNLDVDVFIQVADQDAAVQAAQVENLLSQRIDTLIIAPQDGGAAASLVKMAQKSGVKVIALDRLVLNTKVDAYASFDNEKVGELQGEYLIKVRPKGTYVILSGAPTDNNARLFRQGAMRAIQPLVDKGAIKIVMDQAIADWQPSAAQRLVENALTANHNHIQAILAPNDNTAGAVIQALAAQKLSGKVAVTGQDAELSAIQRIVAGTQTMTVFKDQRKLAREALLLARDLAEKKPLKLTEKVANGFMDVPALLLRPIAIDRDNVDKELIETGYFKKEEVYKAVSS